MANGKAAAAENEIRTRGAAAAQKQRSGQNLSAREKRDIERLRELLDDEARQRHYATVPKKDFVALAGGRQHKQIDDLHRNYGAPCDGKEVNLFKFIRWTFDFLAENGRKLLKAEDGDDLLSGPETPELEKLRKVNRLIKEVEYGKLKTQVLDRAKVHDGLTQIAAQFRDFGDVLQRRFGPDALDLLHQRLDSIEAIIAALCAKPDEENSAELPE